MSPSAFLIQSHIYLYLDAPHLPFDTCYLIRHIFKLQPVGLDYA